MECRLYPEDKRHSPLLLINQHPVVIGRGPITKITDKKCSQKQIELFAEYDLKEVRLKQLGTNSSLIGSTVLSKGSTEVLGPGGVFSLLKNKYQYTVHFVDASNQGFQSNKRKKTSKSSLLPNDEECHVLKRKHSFLRSDVSKKMLCSSVSLKRSSVEIQSNTNLGFDFSFNMSESEEPTKSTVKEEENNFEGSFNLTNNCTSQSNVFRNSFVDKENCINFANCIPIKSHLYIKEPMKAQIDNNEPINEETIVTDEPINEEAIVTDEPINGQTIVTDEPINEQSIVTDEPINEEAIVTDEPINGQTIVTDEPINEQAIVTYEPINKQAIVTDEPINEQAIVTDEPINEQTIVTDEPMNEEAIVTDEPINEQAIVTDEPINEQSIVTDEPINEQTIVTDEPINEQSIVTNEPINEQTIVTNEPTNEQTIVNDEPMNEEAIVNDEPMIMQTFVFDEPINMQTILVDEPINMQTIIVDEPINMQTIIVDGPINMQTIDVDEPIKSQSQDNWICSESLLVFNKKGLIRSNKVLGFDLDHTLITTSSGRHFPLNTADWKFKHSNTYSKLSSYFQQGYKIVIFTNQMGLSKQKMSIEDFKTKLEAVVEKINLPMQCFVSLKDDIYRKPCPGMWQKFLRTYNGGVYVGDSIYVGDAAGRLVNWEVKLKEDVSCLDRCFATNITAKFFTPEEFFLGWKPAKFLWPPFNPRIALTASSSIASFEELFKEKCQEVVLMVGCPASGKSSFVRKYMIPRGYKVINGCDVGSLRKCVSDCKEAITSPNSIVIDDTNPDRETRKRYINVAKQAGVRCRCFHVLTSIEQSLHQNKFRELTCENVKKVGFAAYHFYKSSFKPPHTREGFHSVENIEIVPSFSSDENRRLYACFLA